MRDSVSHARPAVPLREAHAHIAQHGLAMSMVHLEACTGLADLRGILASSLPGHVSRGSWLLGVGLRVESWAEPAWPTAPDLDEATGDHPALLWSFDHHALVVNSAAMRALNIDSGTPDPANGRLERDPRSGDPTGVMLEAGAKLAWNRVPQPTGEERERMVREALADLASHGFAEVHDLVSQPWLGPLLARLDDAGVLPLRVVLYPLLPDLDEVAASARLWQRERIVLGGAKLFADGTLNSRTAWMLSEYVDPLPGMARGQAMLSAGELCGAMRRVWERGVGLAVHAIGDGAVRAVLDAAEEARVPARVASGCPPVRIEHAEIIDGADVGRFADLGVVASVQPCHLLTDIEVVRRVLPHRLDRVLPLRDLIDAGCRPGEGLIFGSDTPIVRPHPEDSIQAAVHRRRAGMREEEAMAPEQAISEAEAWGAFCPA